MRMSKSKALENFLGWAGPLLESLYPVQRSLLMNSIRNQLKRNKYNAIASLVRQVGKTRTACVGLYIFSMLAQSREQFSVFATDTRQHAKDIAWQTLKDLNDEYNLGYEFNAQDLTASHSVHKGTIKLLGFDRVDLVDSSRGIKTCILIIDEAAFISSDHLSNYIHDVTSAGRDAYSAPLWLLTTPGRTKDHYVYRALIDENSRYTVYNWTQYDNVEYPLWAHIKDPIKKRAAVDKYLRDNAKTYITEAHPTGFTNPSYRREYLAEWVEDEEELLHTVHDDNFYTEPPDNINPNTWCTAIGLDIGYNDACSWVVIGLHVPTMCIYELETICLSKLPTSDILKISEDLYSKYKDTLELMTADSSTGGANLIEDWQSNYGFPAISPKKHEKLNGILRLQSLLDDRRIKLKHNSPLAQQIKKQKWNKLRTSNDPKVLPRDAYDAYRYILGSVSWIPEEMPDENPEEPEDWQEDLEEMYSNADHSHRGIL